MSLMFCKLSVFSLKHIRENTRNGDQTPISELDRSVPASTTAPSDSEESPHSWPRQPAMNNNTTTRCNGQEHCNEFHTAMISPFGHYKLSQQHIKHIYIFFFS